MKGRRLNLNKILNSPRNRAFIEKVFERVEISFVILDVKKKEVYRHGKSGDATLVEEELVLDGKVLGYIRCDSKDALSIVKGVVLYIIESELEKKELANEAIRRYRELALLYKFSESIAAILDKIKIAKTAVSEIKKIIKADDIFVVLISEEGVKLISEKGIENRKLDPALYDVMDSVLDKNDAQILNDYTLSDGNKVSLMCAPLKSKQEDIGAIFAISKSLHYSSEDLKLFSAVAVQTGYAIENAILHERQLEEERFRSNFGRLYIVTVIIFSIVALMPDTSEYPAWLQMLLSWGCLFAILIPVLIMAKKMNVSFSTFGVSFNNLKKSVIEGILFSVFLVPTVILYKKITAPGEPVFTWRTMKNYSVFAFWFYVITYTIHCYLQEFIARGVIQGSLAIFMKDQHFIIPILLAASIFGIAHIHISYQAALTTFVISFVFGYIYYRHNNLIGVAIVHYILGLTAIAVGLI